MNPTQTPIPMPPLALLLALAFTLAAGSPARAAEDDPPQGLDARIDLELIDASAGDVLAAFGPITGRTMDVQPGVEGTVTIEIHNVTARTALTAVCESIGCRWSERGAGSLWVAPATDGQAGEVVASGLDERIDMALYDADVREVLRSFASIFGTETEIAAEVSGKVTIEVEGLAIRDVLDRLCKVQGCRWELVETGAGRVLRVTKR